MNNSTKVAIYLIGLGMALTAFAYDTFATKEKVDSLHADIRIIRADVKNILKHLPTE